MPGPSLQDAEALIGHPAAEHRSAYPSSSRDSLMEEERNEFGKKTTNGVGWLLDALETLITRIGTAIEPIAWNSGLRGPENCSIRA